MSQPTHCPDCGAGIPSGQPRGLCPRCALHGALELVPVEPALGLSAVASPLAPLNPGDRVGRYRILEKLGEGGCGMVYLAEQEEPIRRQVALKVIKLGMDTREVIARFEAERQALALMDHPHIAGVLDAGATDTGRPYFVMELVRGTRITDYCDQHRLTTRERLELFARVCQAIQHAHQKGIIHRDIKPSNILVTSHDGPASAGAPKVIDFGIAKATGDQQLTDKTLFTAAHQFLGTPAYMSPEQAGVGALDIDTRTDIYSLGVLLYELLIGRTPFDARQLMASGLDALRRAIREAEPVKPSTRLTALISVEQADIANQRGTEPGRLATLLRGDLDWIVMKAMEKDRARRYESASGLAMDLERHQRSEPITARAPGTAYRIRKFSVRNRKLVAAAAVFLSLLLGWGVTVTTQWRKARLHLEQTEETLGRTVTRQAQQAFETDQAADGVAYLADLLRRQPANRVAAEQLLSALTFRSFPLHVGETIRGDAGATIQGSRFSPDGSRLLAMINRGKGPTVARLWSAETGASVSPVMIHGPDEGIELAEFSPDGSYILTVSSNSACVWDAQTGLRLSGPLRHGTIEKPMACRLSPDGRALLTISAADVWLWHLPSGRLLTNSLASAPGSPISAAAFSPDGQRILVAGQAGICLWDTALARALTVWPLLGEPAVEAKVLPTPSPGRRNEGKPRVWLPNTNIFTRATFSTNGALAVAILGDGSVVICNGVTGELVHPPLHREARSRIETVQISPDGARLLTRSKNRQASLWDTRSGRSVVLLPHADQSNNLVSKVTNTFLRVEFGAGGSTVIGVGEDERVRMWNAAQGHPMGTPFRFAHWGESKPLPCLSPDGAVILAPSNHSAFVLSARTGVLLDKPMPHRGLTRFDFSPDGRRALTVEESSAKVWDVATGESVGEPIRLQSYFAAANLSPNGRTLVIEHWASERVADLWDCHPRRAIVPARAEVRSDNRSPDGTQFIAYNYAVPSTWSIFDMATGNRLRGPFHFPFTNTYGFGFSVDNQQLVLLGDDRKSLLTMTLDAKTGRTLGPPLRIPYGKNIGPYRMSRDGRWLVTTEWEASAIAFIWELRGKTSAVAVSRFVCDGLPNKFDFSPDGRWIATANDTLHVGAPGAGFGARIWDLHSGRPVSQPFWHDTGVQNVRFSPQSDLLATSAGKSVRLWNALAGQAQGDSMNHESDVKELEFSRDGHRLLTRTRQGTSRLWDTRSGLLLTAAPLPESWRFTDFPPIPLPVPAWLPDLAEAVTCRRLSPTRVLEFIPNPRLERVRPLIHQSADDFYTRWARWYFDNSNERNPSPFSGSQK